MAENLTTELGHIIPDVYFDKVNLHSEGEKLIVKINAHLKDFVESDVISSWLADEDFASCFRVKMYYSLNPAVTDYAIENTLFSAAGAIPNEGTFESQGLDTKGFGKSKDVKFVKSDYISVSDSGNEIIEIPLKQQTIELDETPAHLTVFFHPRVDLKTLVGSIGLGGQKLTSDFVNSKKIFAFTIFDNGQIVSTQKQFITEDDVDKSGDLATVWNGPVHYHRPGTGRKGFMKGATMPQKFDSDQNYWLDVPHDWLELIDVPYNIVQDFRSVTRLEQTQLDLTQIDNQLMPAMQAVEKFAKTTEGNKMVGKKPRYFSELFVSRNDENEASLVFVFDQRQFLKNNSTYRALFALSQYSDGKAVEDILLENSRISSIQIYRTRIDKKAPDDDGPTLIVSSGQGIGQIEVTPAVSGLNNYFGELTEKMNLSKGLRVFPVFDREIKDINAGKYSYRVSLEVTDPTIPYIKEQLTKLHAAQATFEKYYQTSLGYTGRSDQTPSKITTDSTTGMPLKTSFPFYDYLTEKFRPEFQKSVAVFGWESALSDLREVLFAIYGSNFNLGYAGTGQALFGEGKVLGAAEESVWLSETLTAYGQTDPLFTEKLNKCAALDPIHGSFIEDKETNKWVCKVSHKKFDKLIKVKTDEFAKMVSPKTGSPDGIKVVIEVMGKFVTALEKMVDVPKLTGPADKSSSNKAKATKALRAEYTFSESFDTSESTGVGYHYMSLPDLDPSRRFGLKEYNPSWVDTRVNLETNKYFGLDQPTWDWGERLGNTDYKGITDGVNIQKYSFISPSKIYTLTLGSTEQLEKGGIYNKKKYQKLLLDIIQYKKTKTGATFDFKAHPGLPSKEKNKDWHAMRSGLIDIMSEENCVMISKEGFSEGAFSFKSFKSIFGSLGLPNFFGKKDNRSPSLDSTKKEESIPYTVPSDQEDYNPNSLFLYLIIKNILEKEGMAIGSIKNLHYDAHDLNEDFFAYDYQAAYIKYFKKLLKDYGKMDAMKLAKKKVFTDLPNQLKALIANSETIYSKYAQNVDPKDPMKDPKSFMAIWMNFKNLMKVEYFQGFITDKTNETNFLGLPAWTTLPTDYKSLGSTDKPFLLCRLTRHVDEQFGIVESPLLDLPVFDQYFLINAADTSTIAAGLLPEVELGLDQISGIGVSGLTTTGAAPVAGTPAGSTATELGIGGPGGAADIGGFAMKQLDDLAKAANAGTKTIQSPKALRVSRSAPKKKHTAQRTKKKKIDTPAVDISTDLGDDGFGGGGMY